MTNPTLLNSPVIVDSLLLTMDSNEELELEFLPFFRKYKSGRIERLSGTTVVPASLDPATGVTSKDVVIDPTTTVSARLYLPNINDGSKLPTLVYFHGGGFILHSPSSPLYHNYLTTLAAKASILIISVDYRRAPEHPLPAAYDDSWAALNWVVSNTDDWLAEYSDSTRLFIAGDSAGANIAHHMAMRAGDGTLGVEVKGLVLVHPFFMGGETRGDVGLLEELWRVVCPGTVGVEEDPLINPMAATAKSLKWLGCRRVVVFVAEKELLRERGRGYYEWLTGSGWRGEAELVESEGEDHVFHLLRPECENAVGLMEKFVDFLKRG